MRPWLEIEGMGLGVAEIDDIVLMGVHRPDRHLVKERLPDMS